jgi:hypothetical protein
MDMTFTNDDEYVSTYDDDSVLIRDSVQLFDGQYAYDGDSQLREYNNGRYFIISIHPFELINGSFYHPDDENKPEETTEDYSEPLTTITAHPTTGVTTSSNIIITSSTASTGTYSFYHPSQIYNNTFIGVIENNLTIESLAEAVEELSQHLPTESETAESPDQFLI